MKYYTTAELLKAWSQQTKEMSDIMSDIETSADASIFYLQKEIEWIEEILSSRSVLLGNAFSLQMLQGDTTIQVTELYGLPQMAYTSVIGHQDTANVLGVEMNRKSVSLSPGDTLVVAQLTGGRLPEGSTTLPEGFRFKFLLVEIL